MTTAFFLKDIENPDFRKSLDQADIQALETFLEEVTQGAGDGELDVLSQETGRGYYAHLELLETQPGAEARAAYLANLKRDIEAWGKRDPGNHQVGVVSEKLKAAHDVKQ